MDRKMILAFAAGVVATAGLLASLPDSALQVAMATTEKAASVKLSPTKALPERDTYFPGTEEPVSATCAQFDAYRPDAARLLVAISQPTQHSAGCGHSQTLDTLKLSRHAQET